jgi:hypothetical protein
MTEAELITENEALHALLADACGALLPFADAEFKVWKGTTYGDACREARACLERVRDGR